MLKKISNFVSTLAYSGFFGFLFFLLLLPLWALLCIIAGFVDGIKAPKESDVKEVDHVSQCVITHDEVVDLEEREYVKKLPKYKRCIGKYNK